LLSQSLLSSISVVVFYKINKIFFSQRISLFGTLVFSIFPIHIYACGQISSAILQSFLIILFFYLFFKIINKDSFFNIIFFSLVSALLILLRGEFIAFFILSILFMKLFLKINIKNFITIILLTALFISPHIVRNIILLDKVVITQSFGYNLWKGNNPYSNVEGNVEIDANIKEQIKKLPKNKHYDLNVDKVFENEAIKNIKTNPLKYFGLYIQKVLSFIFIDINSSYPNYYNPLNYLPILIIGITTVFGIVLSDIKSYKMNFVILYFLANIGLISVFFILPRYSVPILSVQIILSNIFFQRINNIFFKS